ncbi:hypothetical protein [Benzoatithermus flavus]|uniref:Hemolysin-type calcium-binding repeat-containing protein n=1 Tax=Benzoatithermus flavus TaxID=3108223 RepID=A0ABU8XXG1_9PROT
MPDDLPDEDYDLAVTRYAPGVTDGTDTLRGLGGDGVLRGGFGADLIRGDAGWDRLHGEAGADLFVFGPGDTGPAPDSATSGDFHL